MGPMKKCSADINTCFFFFCQRLASQRAETPLFSAKRHIFSPVIPTVLDQGSAVSVRARVFRSIMKSGVRCATEGRL